MSQKNNTLEIGRLLESRPERMAELSIEAGAWRFDAGLTPISDDAWRAESPDDVAAVDALFRGEIVNRSERRPALHPWLRATDEDLPEAFRADRRRMLDQADPLHAGNTPVRNLLHVGIGGSDLGPRLVVDALDADDSVVQVHWLSTLDTRGLDRLFRQLDPATTGLVVASKSFGTRETRLQAEAVRDWLGQDWASRSWAATANASRAAEWGIDTDRILTFDPSIGGRFSLWSSVGISAAARIGRAAFENLLSGARSADEQVRNQPGASLAGRLACAVDQLVRVHGFSTLGVVSYAPGLKLLAAYLQQLVMESLGKRVTPDGRAAAGPSSPLLFGGAGTDLQHAVFQAVHQGMARHPMILLGELPQDDDPYGFQLEQLSNLLGQARTLALGNNDPDPNKALPGGNPAMTLLTRRLDAHALGQLLAHWEHAVYLLGLRWNLNPFDQWGVEEGKVQARALLDPLMSGQSSDDPALAPLLHWIRTVRTGN